MSPKATERVAARGVPTSICRKEVAPSRTDPPSGLPAIPALKWGRSDVTSAFAITSEVIEIRPAPA